MLSYLILTGLFFLFFFLVLISIFPLLDTRKKTYLKNNWAIILLILLVIALLVSLPLNGLAKEIVINQDNFQVHLKIIQRPLPPPHPSPLPWLKSLKNFLSNWSRFFNF